MLLLPGSLTTRPGMTSNYSLGPCMFRPQHSPGRARLVAVAAALVLGCTSSEVRNVVGPGDDTSGNGGGVQRATLTVNVSVASTAQAAATALGWGNVVPGAEVRIVRFGSSAELLGVTSSQGVVTFSDLVPGDYRISSGRTFDDHERIELAASGVTVDALGGGLSVAVTAPSTGVAVPLSGGTRGSLVFSEATASIIRDPTAGDYFFGQFIEIHNNSDTTIYLDGKTLMKGFPGTYDYPMFPCSLYTAFNQDPLGVWGRHIYRFPGSGTNYPIAPGATATIAADAIDHSGLVVGGLDLTAADFEFRGASDTDNPSVPDMVSIGPSDGGYVGGHGLQLHENREVLVLAEYVDPGSLPSAQIANITDPYNRIAAALILDVITLRRDFQETYPQCGESAVHPQFDSQDARLLSRYDPNSAQRRVLFVDSAGRVILQRTGTSSVDMKAGEPTPGSVQ